MLAKQFNSCKFDLVEHKQERGREKNLIHVFTRVIKINWVGRNLLEWSVSGACILSLGVLAVCLVGSQVITPPQNTKKKGKSTKSEIMIKTALYLFGSEVTC